MNTQSEQTKHIFIAGINSTLGCLLASQLSHENNVQLTGMISKEFNQENEDALKQIQKTNPTTTLFEGEITKEESYNTHLKNVNVIVSIVSNEKTSILDGQMKLYENGIKYGNLKKFIPSEFTCNYTMIPYGESEILTRKRMFAEWIDSKDDQVKVVHILTGYTYKNILEDFDVVDMDCKPKKFKYYGDENQHFDLTDEPDVSKTIFEAIFDDEVPSRLCVSGDSISASKFVESYNNNFGKKEIVLERMGDIETLEEEIEKIRQSKYKDISKLNALGFQLSMFKPMRGKLVNLRNVRYPNIHFTTIDQYFQKKKYSMG